MKSKTAIGLFLILSALFPVYAEEADTPAAAPSSAGETEVPADGAAGETAENEAAPVSLKKNKLGFVFGMPVALSYSHEFTDLVELDLLVSTYPFLWRLIGEMSVYCGVLFTLADGVVKDRPWALTLGPSVGTTLLFSGGFDASLDLYADLRWEIDFPQTSRVNFFLNLGWGAVMRFDGGTVDALFPPRGGFGVRGRF